MRNFNKTIDVLVKAYLNNTLKHQDCFACAVGNIVADSMGIKFKIDNNRLMWDGVEDGYYPGGNSIINNGGGWGAIIINNEPNVIGEKQIKSTGYSVEELRSIERAFESVKYSPGIDLTEDELIFNRLMAVVNVLAEIHGIDLETKESTKKLFNKELQLN